MFENRHKTLYKIGPLNDINDKRNQLSDKLHFSYITPTHRSVVLKVKVSFVHEIKYSDV